MTITRTRTLTALAAIAALALAGCGGSSAEDDASKQIEAANSQVAAAASSAQEAANQAASQAQAAASQIAGAASSMVDQAQSQADAAASSAEAELSAAMSDAEELAGDSAASDPAAGDTALAEDTSADATVEAVAGPYEKGGFAAIVKQLEGELGYSPQVLQVVLSADFAQFQVRDKSKPKNVDQYEWRDGAFSDPVPVKLVGDGDLGANVFPLKVLVAKPDVPVKLHAAGEALSIDEPEVSTMIAQRMLPFSTDVRWLVNVGGSREDKQLRATPGGKVVEIV